MQNNCRHQNQQIMFCLIQDCKYNTCCICRLCIHDHQTLFVIKRKNLYQKIQPIFQLVQKRKNIQQQIILKYQEKRRKILEEINKQEKEFMDRLNSIIKRQDAQIIMDINQLKYDKISKINWIINSKYQEQSKIFMQSLEKLSLQINQNIKIDLNNKRIAQQQNNLMEISAPKKKFHQDLPTKLKKQSIIQQQFRKLQSNEQILNKPIEIKSCKSFSQAQQYLLINQQLIKIGVSINFQSNFHQNSLTYRKNIAQFFQSLTYLKNVQELTIEIGKQCRLSLLNQKNLDEKCSNLPNLQKLDLKYYYQSKQKSFDFPKLKNKLPKDNLLINAIPIKFINQ